MQRRRALSQLSACLQGRIPDDADWEGIIGLANETLVTPELYAVVVAQSQTPRDVVQFVSEVYRRSCLRNVSLFGTLKDALAALHACGIEPLLLKGCALWPASHRLDGPPETCRITTDVDLLVPGAAFHDAAQALQDGGFHVLSDDSSDDLHPTMEVGRESDAGSVDIHQFAPGPRGIPELEHLQDYSRTGCVVGHPVRIPLPEMQILITMLHDQLLDGHFWRGGFELRHLVDIASLAARSPSVNWTVLQGICRRAGLLSTLTAQLAAAKQIAGAAVPDTALTDRWGQLHYWRQRAQFVWPAINAPFRAFGLNRKAWRNLSSGARTALRESDLTNS